MLFQNDINLQPNSTAVDPLSVFGSGQFGAQVVGFEIVGFFAVPMPTSPAMMLCFTLGFAACFLSADLPRVRQKPLCVVRDGFWRPYVTDVIYPYLECCDLHFGFARAKCQDCGHEYLLAYSCKRRHFYPPPCHQTRVVAFGEWLCTQVLKSVPHRQWVFSLPKRLRIYFMFDRKLLAKLSRSTWKVLGTYLKQAAPFDDAVCGARCGHCC